MDRARQKAFQKLRPPCIELSSVALKFRAQQSPVKAVLQALQAFQTVLVEVGSRDGLDEKLAEYAFFPLSHIFNESQRLSSRCLEVAVPCLELLISQGWRQKLQPDMGKQLLIMLSLIAGGPPARSKEQRPSEELTCTCYGCMTVLFDILGQSSKRILDETGAKTIVDQSVYLLLEGLGDDPSENVQLSAAKALQSLLSHISSRVLLASLLPRTVSSLTKALKSTTQIRRSFRVLVAILELLCYIISAVLADEAALNDTASPETDVDLLGQNSEVVLGSSILDEKWLKATASQVKLALANVFKLRSHERTEVQHALFNLCLVVCKQCAGSLADSLPLAIDTMLALLHQGDGSSPSREEQALQHLIQSNTDLADMTRSSLNSWLNSLPRLMQSNDDNSKKQVLRQISSAVRLLLESGQASNLLDDSLAASLVSSVSAVVDAEQPKTRAISEPLPSREIMYLQSDLGDASFEPVIFAHKSLSESLVEFRSLIGKIAGSAVHESLTQSIIARAGRSFGSEQVSALWLSLSLLQQNSNADSALSTFVEFPSDSPHTTADIVSDLYSVSLPLLLHSSMYSTCDDWRLSALAVESTVLQATQLRESYRPELIDTLYPILSFLGSPERRLKSHAAAALDLLAGACEYPDTGAMLVDNVDYLVNSIALKLNSFDVSPQGPQVLLMMLRLCGARLIPYLDDMISSIFAALDNFHEYTRLVELLFEVLRALVDEAAKNPTAITSCMEGVDHGKVRFKPSTVEDVLADIRAHKERIQKREAESAVEQTTQDAPESTPHRPWSSQLDKPRDLRQPTEEQPSETKDAQGTSPPQKAEEEKEKPLSKSHSLLLSIARSTIPHLSSPSVQVRLTLLRLLSRIIPLLAKHENSYLPLVNDIWPAVLPRLFSTEAGISQARFDTEHEHEALGDKDPAYVIAAAADTVAAICKGAGDFMSGRIEEIFPQLERVYGQIWSEVESDRQRAGYYRGLQGIPAGDSIVTFKKVENSNAEPEAEARERAAADLKGPVDLRIINPTSTTTINPTTKTTSSSSTSHHHTHTQTHQLHTSLLTLLSTLLTHTHLQDSTADSILSLLGPIMDETGHEHVREALEIWNADAVWVFREQNPDHTRNKRRTTTTTTTTGVGDEKPGPVTWWDGTVWEFGDCQALV